MAKLKFAESEKPEEKVALGMIAKDGEYVPFHGTSDCTGPVKLYCISIIVFSPNVEQI